MYLAWCERQRKSSLREKQQRRFTLARGDKARDSQSRINSHFLKLPCIVKGLSFLSLLWIQRGLSCFQGSLMNSITFQRSSQLWPVTPSFLRVASFGPNLPQLQSLIRFLFGLVRFGPLLGRVTKVWAIKLNFQIHTKHLLVNLKIYQVFGQPSWFLKPNWQHQNDSVLATKVA